MAERIRDEEGAYLPYQYYNQANPEAHYRVDRPGDLAADRRQGHPLGGRRRHRRHDQRRRQVPQGAEPERQGGRRRHRRQHLRATTSSTGELPPADQIHQYLIDGIGEDFLPSTVWWDYIDEIVTIDDKTAYRATMELARKEAIFGGSSAGAAAAGARQVAQRAGRGRRWW